MPNQTNSEIDDPKPGNLTAAGVVFEQILTWVLFLEILLMPVFLIALFWTDGLIAVKLLSSDFIAFLFTAFLANIVFGKEDDSD